MSESAFKAFTRSGRCELQACFGSFKDANKPDQRNPTTYKGNGYIDIIQSKRAFTGDLWGKHCYGFITPRVIELDTPEDWEEAERYLIWQESLHNSSYRTLDSEGYQVLSLDQQVINRERELSTVDLEVDQGVEVEGDEGQGVPGP